MFNQQQRIVLRQLAEQAIDMGLKTGKALSINHREYELLLQEQRSSFVTLEINKRLRGCIGALIATQPLICDVVEHAFAAAFLDARFTPLTQAERSLITLHISVLNPAQELACQSEADLLHQLRPHIDGLILQQANHRATFLPSVWESIPDPKEFVKHLKIKAGFPADYWSKKIIVKVYTAEMID